MGRFDCSDSPVYRLSSRFQRNGSCVRCVLGEHSDVLYFGEQGTSSAAGNKKVAGRWLLFQQGL